ncbi:DUF721 domain-containing protein [bacterium]|nr:DUF721 domain-containing protein [bacterium]
MRKINETKQIDELLNSCAFLSGNSDKRIQYFIKNATLFSFWGDIVGSKFAKFTKPKSIKYSKLYVAVKSPVIMQELLLVKNRLIEKVNKYSKPLGIVVKDVAFDYKSYQENPIKDDFIEDKPIWYKEADFNNVAVDEVFKADISCAISKINFLNCAQKEELISKICKVNKAKKLSGN